jgi:hypothetical protein
LISELKPRFNENLSEVMPLERLVRSKIGLYNQKYQFGRISGAIFKL